MDVPNPVGRGQFYSDSHIAHGVVLKHRQCQVEHVQPQFQVKFCVGGTNEFVLNSAN